MRIALWILCVILAHTDIRSQIIEPSPAVDDLNITDVDGENISNTAPSWHLVVESSPCLRPADRKLIFATIQEEKKLTSWYQLQSVKGLSNESIRCFIQWIGQDVDIQTKGEKDEKWRILLTFRNVMDSSPSTLLKMKGPLSSSSRIGLVLEKDRNEALWTTTGPDYISAFVEKNFNNRLWQKIILGDYRIRLGQGLMLNNFFRKGLVFGELQIPQWTGRKLMPYQSLDENRGLRGLATTWRRGPWNGVIFASHRQMDARVDSNLNQVITMQYSGLHASESELNNKDRIWRTTGGASVGLSYNSLVVNLQVVAFKNNIPTSSSENLYQFFRDTTFSQLAASVDHQWSRGNWQWYGEFALQVHGGFSFVEGLLWNPHLQHRLAFMARGRSIDYDAQLSQSFFRAGFRGNEYGWFVGYQYRPGRHFHFVLNMDQLIYPWWTYLQSPYRQMNQILISAQWCRRRNYQLRAAIRLTERDQKISTEHDIPRENLVSFRLHFIKTIQTGLEWRTRYEYRIRKKSSIGYQGHLYYQELKFKPLESSWEGLIRVSFYHTDGFDGRIYAYTHRLGGVFGIPAYFGSGLDTYVLVRKRWRQFSLSCRGNYSRRVDENPSFALGLSLSMTI